MINPNYTEGRFLFIVNGCPHCAIWEKFIWEFNMKLKPNKRIKVINCTYYDMYGILTDPVIKLYEDRLDGYPILFIEGSKKDGAETVAECKAWLFGKLFNDFISQQRNPFLPTINKPLLFNKICKYFRGMLVCE